MNFMKQDIINSLYKEVDKLLDMVKTQQDKINKLEDELNNKNNQISILKLELIDLIGKVEHFNDLFSELPLYNNSIDEDNKNEGNKNIESFEKDTGNQNWGE